jgi:tetratricopeptide (TPR) repeat protein
VKKLDALFRAIPIRRIWTALPAVRYFLWAAILLLPADTPQGAISSLPACARTPISSAGWGIAFFSDEPLFALQAGQEMLARSEFTRARCYLDIARAAGLNSPEYWLAQGDALWGMGDSIGAISAWEKSGAGSSSATSRLLTGYEKTGQLENASQICAQWLPLHTEDVAAQNRCALIAAVQAPAGALPALDQASSRSETALALAAAIRDALRARDPAYLYARTGEELLAWSEYSLAAAALQKAISLRPDYGDAHALLGLALEKQSLDGSEEYRLAVNASPDSETTCLFFGAWQRRNGQLDSARIWLERAWSLRPGDWAAAGELAALELAAGNVSAGEKWVMESVRLYPQDAAAWETLADFYIRNEIQVEHSGIPAARQAVLLAPKSARALELLGRGHFLIGNFSLADSIFRRALSFTPDSASLHGNLGLTLLQEGDFTGARDELTEAIRLDPIGDTGKASKAALDRMPSTV